MTFITRMMLDLIIISKLVSSLDVLFVLHLYLLEQNFVSLSDLL